MSDEIIGTIRSSIEGPRWAKFRSVVRGVGWERDLELELEIEKGWVRETVRFKVVGTETKLRRFMKILDESVNEYNAT